MARFVSIRRGGLILGALVYITLACNSVSLAQSISRPFAFTLSSTDTTQLSLLPTIEAGPAGAHGAWHLSPEGHFVAADGSRGKFFGTELQWTANFIDSRSALVLAKRLRKMGFNALRLNYLDYFGWDDASLFQTYQSPGVIDTSSYTVNPVQLARFDTLLYTLKQEGIYVFLTLNDYHHFSYGENVPGWDSLYGNSYIAHMLYPQAAWLEHQWARTISLHVNPLTSVAIGKDPSVACYEILQEHSLPWYWSLKRLNYIDTLNAFNRGQTTVSYAQSRRMDTLFAQYLTRKYGSDAALNTGWAGSQNLDQRNILANGSFETIDNTWTLQVTGTVPAKEGLFSPGVDGTYAELVHIGANSGASDPTAVLLLNYTAKCGLDSLYQLSFWARILSRGPNSLKTRTVIAVVSDQSNQSSLGAAQTIDTMWREYRFTFRSITNTLQLAGVFLSNDSGDVVFDNFILKHASEHGLRAGESLANISVARLSYDTLPMISAERARDETMFYDSLQRAYYDGMVHLLRDTLSVAGLVNTSQGNYASTILDYHAYKEGEVTQTHTGWDYVSARGSTPQSVSEWMVRNTPMVRDPGFYAFSIAAAGSVVGKAYVLGEWSVPSPNQYASEQGIIPAVYAAYQDWDGIFFTPYATRREELFADTIIAATINTSPWNNIVSNHALMAQMPFASYVFRMGLVPPSTIFDTIQHDPDDVFLLGHFPPASYRGPFGQDGFMYGDQTVVSAMEVREKFDTKSHTISTYSHDYTDPLFSTYDSTATNSIVLNTASGTFAATEPNLYAFTGFLTDPFSFPTLKIERLDQSGDNLSMYYIFADSEKQGRLSLSTRTQNTGVQWIDSLGYGANVGHAPTIMSAANVRLTFQSYFDSVMLYPLDASGLPAGQMILATRVGSTNKFTATIDQLATHSVWFVVRQAGTGGVDAVKDLAAVLSLDLSISPNPTPARATILLNLLEEEHVTLSLTDDLGREVWRTSANFAAGHSRLPIDVSRIPSGMYVLRMMSGAGMMARGFSVVR